VNSWRSERDWRCYRSTSRNCRQCVLRIQGTHFITVLFAWAFFAVSNSFKSMQPKAKCLLCKCRLSTLRLSWKMFCFSHKFLGILAVCSVTTYLELISFTAIIASLSKESNKSSHWQTVFSSRIWTIFRDTKRQSAGSYRVLVNEKEQFQSFNNFITQPTKSYKNLQKLDLDWMERSNTYTVEVHVRIPCPVMDLNVNQLMCSDFLAELLTFDID
jgi:hypothetical protein